MESVDVGKGSRLFQVREKTEGNGVAVSERANPGEAIQPPWRGLGHGAHGSARCLQERLQPRVDGLSEVDSHLDKRWAARPPSHLKSED